MKTLLPYIFTVISLNFIIIPFSTHLPNKQYILIALGIAILSMIISYIINKLINIEQLLQKLNKDK